MQDEDRPLLHRQASERPLELVTVDDIRRGVRSGRSLVGQCPNVGRPMPRPLRLVVAGVHEDPVDPRLEPVDVPERRQTAPGGERRLLERVLGKVGIAEDPVGQRVEPAALEAHQFGERIAIATLRVADQLSPHRTLRGGG